MSVPVTIACRPKPKEINCRIVNEQPEADNLTTAVPGEGSLAGSPRRSIAPSGSRKKFFHRLVFSAFCLELPHWRACRPTGQRNRENPSEALFFRVENDWQFEPMPFPFNGNQDLIAWIPRLDCGQEIIRSPHSLASHCDDQIRA